MKQVTHFLSSGEKSLIRACIGSTWISLSGADMPDSDFAWDEVLVLTSSNCMRIGVELNELQFEGWNDEYARLNVSNASTECTRSSGMKSYFQGRHQTVREAWIVRDSLTARFDDATAYMYSADVCMAFQLDTECIAVGLRSHRTEALVIARANSKENLNLPRLEDRWPSTLVETYEYRREWMQPD